jgi:phosphate transport system permease protein
MALITPAAAGATARDVVQASLTRRDRDTAGLILLILLLIGTGFSMLVLFVLLAQIVVEAWPVIENQGLDFLTTTIGSDPATTGIWPGLYGSFFIGLGVILVAIPLGVSAAVYLEEYASQRNRLTRLIMVNIRNLAGVPAVIYGVLGLIIFVEWLGPVTQGETVIAAALTMAVLVLPIVIITSMEAIRAVPQGLRDAGYGVGASRWEVTRDHVLPYAAPGILTGTVLSMARALGEAAPLIIIGAITGRLPETGILERFTALPMLIFSFSGRPDQPGAQIGWSNVAAAAGLVLLVLVLFFNAAAILLRNRFEKRRAGT